MAETDLSIIHTADSGAATRPHLLGLTLDELAEALARLNQPAYRARQVFEWVYRHGVTDFERMTNLPKALRAELAGRFAVLTTRVRRHAASTDGTQKLLLELADGETVETVWIPADGRNTACVSSQVGCPVGCRFCASGLDGVKRNLRAGEIVEQALRIDLLIRTVRLRHGVASRAVVRDADSVASDTDVRRAGGKASAPGTETTSPRDPFPPSHVPTSPRRTAGGGCPPPFPPSHLPTFPRTPPRRQGQRGLTHIVLMGMGEPLANYAQVVRALRLLNASWGLNIGARRITLSTVGLPDRIRRLASEGLPINLALSLHATDESLRRELIPWAERFSLREILDACAEYFRRTGREVTLEYVLLAGVNDRKRDARELAKIARRLRGNVNLLRYNPVPGLPYERPSASAAHAFQQRLRSLGVNAHIRRSRGTDVAAACGQLRRSAK